MFYAIFLTGGKKMEKGTFKLLFVAMIFLSVAIGLAVMALMMDPSTVQTTARTAIPIELEVTAEPSTIKLGETSVVTIKLLDENGNPTASKIDVDIEFVEIHTSTRRVVTMVVIPAGKESVSIPHTPDGAGIAMVSAKSRGLTSDTSSVAVIPAT